MKYNEMDKLDQILNRTIESIEKSKTEMYEIYEKSYREYLSLKNELSELKKKIRLSTRLIEGYEKQLARSKVNLMEVSKNFDQSTEEKIKEVYDETDQLRIDLAVEKEREKSLINKRNELEVRIKALKEIVNKANNLINNVSVAMKFLTGDLKNLSSQIGDIKEKRNIGIKILIAQEEERRRIAREIHDGPAQYMSNLVLKAEYCIKLLDNNLDEAKMELGKLKELLRSGIQELRGIIYDLRPMSLDDLGLVPTIERYISKVMEEKDIVIKLSASGSKQNISNVIKLTIYRLAQEAISNIIKHSNATEAKIKLTFLQNYIELIVSDNGEGFDISELKKQRIDGESGFGLCSMKERTELLDGKFVIQSKPKKGTRYYFRIPC